MFFCISSVLYLILNCCCYYILIGHIGLHWRSRHEYVREAVTPAGGIPRGESQNWTEWAEHFESVATVNKWDTLRDIVSYAVICRVCPRHGMQIHIQTCTCADRYTYSYLDMPLSSAVCRWVLLGLSIGCVPHPYRER